MPGKEVESPVANVKKPPAPQGEELPPVPPPAPENEQPPVGGPEVRQDDEDQTLTLRGWSMPGWLRFGPWSDSIRTFLVEVNQELKKVTWPSRRQVITETLVVLVVVVILTVAIVALDHLFGALTGWLLGPI